MFRSEVFINLKIGSSFAFDAGLGCYCIDLTKLQGKGKTGPAAALVKIPRSETKVIDRWIKVSLVRIVTL